MTHFGSRFFLALVVLVVAGQSAAADLSAGIRSAVNGSGLSKASISVCVRDVPSGTILASRAGETPMIPASNMKALTTGAALATLGTDFCFRTRMVQDGDRLIIIGDGDPGFADPELLGGLVSVDAAGNAKKGLTVDALLDSWVTAAAASMPKGISEVVVDDRIFARERIHPEWPKDQLDEAYCAEVSGINFHGNLVHVFPRPVPGGKAEIASMVPSARWMTLSSRATSKQGKKDSNTAWVSRAADGTALTLQGNVKTTYAEPIVMPMRESAVTLGRAIADRIAARGVSVKSVRVSLPGDPKSDGDAVGPVIRTPIGTAITRANTDSENLYAEALLKRMTAARTGQPGSWALGATVLRDVTAEWAGTGEIDGFAFSDGSGLSKQNRVTAEGMTAFMAAMARHPQLSQPYLESLAIAGRTGTVRKRMAESAQMGVTIRCKTGYVNGVSCLSGIACADDGRMQAFSVLCNSLTEPDAVGKAKRLQDRIALLVAQDLLTRAPAPALGG